jgi:putative membrane protein
VNRRTRPLFRGAAVLGVAALATGMWMPTASAADGDVVVINTETVQSYTSPTGEVESSRVYEQLALTGNGSVDLRNPVSTDGLRNLDGFGGWEVADGEQVATVDVDGEERLRSVSDFDGDLPIGVQVVYTLDGERVEPGDVVGESGKLEVQYTVENRTAEPQEVSFPDGNGGTVTRTVDVPIPIVGSLTTTAPSNFTNVRSEQANVAGDGKGGTTLSFTMTLFPPIGSTTAVFSYTADIVDGVVPRSNITALPVNPLDVPSFQTAAESYQGGADTGAELAAGATEIDSNLLKLRDGASDLLAGLIQLRDGSNELEQGLAGSAVPGSRQLADGAGELNAGLGLINSGSKRLAAGTGEAFAGSSELAAGARRLDGGLGELGGGVGDLGDGADRLAAGQKALAAGLKDLYDGVDDLPSSVKAELDDDASYQALLGALEAIAEGVGSRADAPDAGTLLGGLNAVQYGLRHPAGYGANDCAVALGGGTPSRCGAMDGVQFVAEQLSSGATDLNQLRQVLIGLNVANACPGAPSGFVPPPAEPATECELVSTLHYALFGVAPAPLGAQAKVNAAANALQTIQQGVQQQLLGQGAGLDQLRAGLSNGNPAECLAAKQTPTPSDDCGIKEAATFLQLHGLPMLVDGITNSISAELLAGIGQPTAGCDPEKTLRCAAAALADGGGDLTAGVGKLVAGVAQLSDGGALLAAGAGDLSAGLGQIDDGASELAAGAGDAAEGSGRLAAGAGELADGLEDAANGTSRLSAGLGEAAKGAPKLVDGAQRLSDEGTKKLVEAGESTAQN